jgi:hypothetical protein
VFECKTCGVLLESFSVATLAEDEHLRSLMAHLPTTGMGLWHLLGQAPEADVLEHFHGVHATIPATIRPVFNY